MRCRKYRVDKESHGKSLKQITDSDACSAPLSKKANNGLNRAENLWSRSLRQHEQLESTDFKNLLVRQDESLKSIS